MENLDLRPNDRRAKNAISLIWAVIAVNLVASFSDMGGNLLFGEEYYSEYFDEDNVALTLYTLATALVGLTLIAVTITSAVTFIMWLRRAYYNLHQTPVTLSYGEGWAAGAWFVPIMNLFVPYKIMKELYEKTNIILLQNLKTCSVQLRLNNITPWWTLWIISGFIEQIVLRLSMQDVRGTFVDTLSITASIMTFICGLITIKIIKEYSAVEPLIEDALIKDNYHLSEETPLQNTPTNN